MNSSLSDQPEHSHGSWLGRLLDLDAEIHSGVLEEAMAISAEAVGDAEKVHRVLDIGAGTGTGSVALAGRFPSAEIVAVDVDEQMLATIRARSRAAGLERRITPLAADVAAAMPTLGSADLAWSSAVLHEVSDQARAFQNLFDALVPGGLLAVLEMDEAPRVLPAHYAAFEERLHVAGRSSVAADHPEWTDAIAGAGFSLIRKHSLVADQRLPADGPAGEFAAIELRRLGHGAIPALSDSDRATLLALAGEGDGGVRSLGELRIRGARTLWVARRP